MCKHTATPIDAPPAILGTARHPLAPLNAPFILLVRLYQVTLSPIVGRSCRFHPTCSAYAVAALRHHAPWRALWLTAARLARCHPLGGSGYDPVPPPRSPRPQRDANTPDPAPDHRPAHTVRDPGDSPAI